MQTSINLVQLPKDALLWRLQLGKSLRRSDQTPLKSELANIEQAASATKIKIIISNIKDAHPAKSEIVQTSQKSRRRCMLQYTRSEKVDRQQSQILKRLVRVGSIFYREQPTESKTNTTYRNHGQYSYYLELDGGLRIMAQMLDDLIASNTTRKECTDHAKPVSIG